MCLTYKKLGGGEADESLSLFRSLRSLRSRSLSRSLLLRSLLLRSLRFDDGLGVRRIIFGLFVFFGDLEKRFDCFRICLRGSCGGGGGGGGDFERDRERLLLRLFDLKKYNNFFIRLKF